MGEMIYPTDEPKIKGPRSVLINLRGKTFGYLTVIKRVKLRSEGARYPKKYTYWLCQCECGTMVVKRGVDLRKGRVKACAVKGHRWKDVSQRREIKLP